MTPGLKSGSIPVIDSTDAELTRLRAEVERLTAALATETRAVERLAERCGANCPPQCPFEGQGCLVMLKQVPSFAACWAAWARQKEVKE